MLILFGSFVSQTLFEVLHTEKVERFTFCGEEQKGSIKASEAFRPEFQMYSLFLFKMIIFMLY